MIPTTLVKSELALRVLGGDEGYAIGGGAREAFEATPTPPARLGPDSRVSAGEGCATNGLGMAKAYIRRVMRVLKEWNRDCV